jgi:hypothetical protein
MGLPLPSLFLGSPTLEYHPVNPDTEDWGKCFNYLKLDYDSTKQVLVFWRTKTPINFLIIDGCRIKIMQSAERGSYEPLRDP